MRYTYRLDFKKYILILLITALAGCSSGEQESVQDNQVRLHNLVGLWDSSEKNGAKTDVMYTRISSTGDIIEYDFDGDEVDKGLNCYHIDSGKIIPLNNNLFTITTDMHNGQTFEVELELLDAGHALKIYFFNDAGAKGGVLSGSNAAANVDGQAKSVRKAVSSQIWTRMRDSARLDKEPSCSR